MKPARPRFKPGAIRPLIAIGFGPEIAKRAKAARWRGLDEKDKAPHLTRGERNCRWIEKHCRIPDGVDVGKAVRLRQFQLEIVLAIYDNPHGTRRAIISFGKKNAKALSLSCAIPTPYGWKTIGDIEAGDLVYGSDGRPTRVLATSEVFLGKPCFRVGFSDGSSIVASEDHVWTTRHRFRPWAKARRNGSGNGGRWIVENVTTRQIAESVHVKNDRGLLIHNHKIDAAPALVSDPIPLPISPYVLGAWLGDGTSTEPEFTVGEPDLASLVERLEASGEGEVRVRLKGDRAANVRLKGGLRARLRALGVLGDKHIPAAYFDAGTDQRRDLLRGLMDTDGTVNRHAGRASPRCSFSNSNERLARDVWRLARSLGLKATIREGRATIGGRDCGPTFRVSFAADQADAVFGLTRKADLLPPTKGKRASTLAIVSCEPVESVPTKCLMVDAADSLFLAGHGCVPTHNTSLTAFLVLLHLCGPEAQRQGQLPSTALSRDQAATLYKLAAACVRQSPTLGEFVTCRDSLKELYCDELGTLYKALSADAKTKHGMSPVFAVHDELGQVKGPSSALYDGIENAMGAHAEPLSIIISTQAASDADLLSQLIDDAKNGDDPQTVVMVYAAPENELDADGEEIKGPDRKPIPIDPFSERALLMANPAAGDFLNIAELRRMARDAKRMPSKEARFRNFTLNQRIDVKNPFVSRSAWRKCGMGAIPTIDDLVGLDVYGGLDLSQVRDLTAFVLIGWTGSKWLTVPTFWLPEHEIEEKSRTDKTSWDVWAREGFLELTPGLTVDYSHVAARIYDLCQQLDVQRIGFDRWKMDHLKRELSRVGFEDEQLEGDDALFVGFGQGFKDMAPALDVLEGDILNQRIEHGGHPVLGVCAANAVVKQDEAGNRKLNKPDSHGRIDGLVALAMARGVAGTYEPEDEIDVFAMVG